MPSSPNKLSRFWQELKRRNVTRVLAVYIAAAFMILELISMFSEQIGLPDGTWKVAFIISLAGLLIAVIVSWVYDIHPKGGIVKTESADKVKTEDIPKSSNNWKIASYISFLVIVGLIVLNIIPRTGKKEILDKSIAVLPFVNDSPVSENEYYIKGYCSVVHSNLCKIKDLRVKNLLSTEQYRNQSTSIPEIAKELGVAYVLSARGQIINNRVNLTVNLTNQSGDVVWSNPYDRQIEVVDDHISIQSEIAQLVAEQLQAVITPEERGRMEKLLTTSLDAYEYYLRGVNETIKSFYYGEDQGSPGKAKAYFLKALEYDPNFAAAYTGLARLYLEENPYRSLVDTAYTDSTLVLINLALSLDDELADAYHVRGEYYKYERGNYQQAIRDMKKAIELNPSNSLVYQSLAYLYANSLFEFVPAFENLQKVLLMQKGVIDESTLKDLAATYLRIGFYEKNRSYVKKVLELNGDTLGYLGDLSLTEKLKGNYPEHLRLEKLVFERDSSSNEHWYMGDAYRLNRQFDKSLYHYEYCLGSDTKEALLIDSRYRIGYVYWQKGMEETALEYFNKQIEVCKRARETNSDYFARGDATYAMAATYAFMGDKDKAYENLKAFSLREKFPARMIPLIKSDPLFDSIQDEPEFKQIFRDIEAKYQAEHERVRQWLEENDML